MSVTAAQLFAEAFLPLYPEDAAQDLAGARARDANPARNPTILAHLADAARIFVEMAPAVLGHASIALDFSDASVHRLSAALGTNHRDAWMREPGYGTSESTLFNFVVHGAAYVGECIVRNHGGAWLVRRPLWESLVALASPAGEAQLAIFQWWLKALADEAFEARGGTLADRYRTHVEVPTLPVSGLPIFVATHTERRLPRMTKPRYDVLYKYLRAHLPELKDLGRDFPSPERLDDMRLRWLDAHVLGEGRMVLLAGAGEGGVHLFWLDGQGFVKAAFYAADSMPEPIVRVEADRIKVLARYEQKDVAHEMLWWGP